MGEVGGAGGGSCYFGTKATYCELTAGILSFPEYKVTSHRQPFPSDRLKTEMAVVLPGMQTDRDQDVMPIADKTTSQLRAIAILGHLNPKT